MLLAMDILGLRGPDSCQGRATGRPGRRCSPGARRAGPTTRSTTCSRSSSSRGRRRSGAGRPRSSATSSASACSDSPRSPSRHRTLELVAARGASVGARVHRDPAHRPGRGDDLPGRSDRPPASARRVVIAVRAGEVDPFRARIVDAVTEDVDRHGRRTPARRQPETDSDGAHGDRAAPVESGRQADAVSARRIEGRTDRDIERRCARGIGRATAARPAACGSVMPAGARDDRSGVTRIPVLEACLGRVKRATARRLPVLEEQDLAGSHPGRRPCVDLACVAEFGRPSCPPSPRSSCTRADRVELARRRCPALRRCRLRPAGARTTLARAPSAGTSIAPREAPSTQSARCRAAAGEWHQEEERDAGQQRGHAADDQGHPRVGGVADVPEQGAHRSGCCRGRRRR